VPKVSLTASDVQMRPKHSQACVKLDHHQGGYCLEYLVICWIWFSWCEKSGEFLFIGLWSIVYV